MLIEQVKKYLLKIITLNHYSYISPHNYRVISVAQQLITMLLYRQKRLILLIGQIRNQKFLLLLDGKSRVKVQ